MNEQDKTTNNGRGRGRESSHANAPLAYDAPSSANAVGPANASASANAVGAANDAGAESLAAVRRGTRNRIEFTFYGLIFVLLFLAANLVRLQAFGGAGKGMATQTRTQVIEPRRGDILAADGTAIAVTLDEYTVAANPRALSPQNRERMAKQLAQTIGGDASEYSEELQSTEKSDGKPNYYVRLARRVDEKRIAKLRALMRVPADLKRAEKIAHRKFWAAISLEPSPRRNYPLGEFASQLVGFVNEKGASDGLEWAWNKQLSGKAGEVVSQVDARHRPVPGFVDKISPATPGLSVVTTIDPEIQADTDAALREVWKKFKPNFITAIVMKPRTGEVVAMSTAPSFNLNNRPHNVADLMTNRALNFSYEPGSTFKIITAAAVVENVPDWASRSFYCNGVQRVGKHIIHNWNYSLGSRTIGQESLSSAMRDSSNITMYNFARLIGRQKFVEYSDKFGIGEKVEFDGLRSPSGWVAPRPKEWGEAQFANFSFGQGMLVTPMQLLRAVSAIGNDGVMMKPMLVKEVRDERGQIVKRFKPEAMRRVVSPQTAAAVTSMMERVTSEGTARKYVFVPGYPTAGKTGSAQKAVGKHGYAAGKFISSFVGFVPSRKPEYAVLIVADEPHGSHWGSEVCGPPFGIIANKAMLHLRLREGSNAPTPNPHLMTQPKLAQKN